MPLDHEAAAAPPATVLMTADAVGGVWTYALELAEGLARAGTRVHIALLGPAPQAAEIERVARNASLSLAITGLPLDWTARCERDLELVTQHLQWLAGETGADLVHLNAPALAGTRPWRVPLVTSIHSCLGTWWRTVHGGSLPDEYLWHVRRTAQGLGIADALIAPSTCFAAMVRETYGAGLSIDVVPNGTAIGRVKDGPPRTAILTAGRLWDTGKNVLALDQAARSVSVPILAAGAIRGPNGEHVPLSHLHLLGNLSRAELDRWYRRAAIFVSASRYEPFGLAVLEAAAAGAALVLSDIPTFRELWEGAALFADPDDHGAIAEALNSLIARPALKERLADAAAMRAASFSSASMVDGTLHVYAKVLGKADSLSPTSKAVYA